MIFRCISKILILIFVISCSSTVKQSSQEKFETPELLYFNAMIMFDNKQYAEANLIFKNIEKIYPLSNEAIQSQIMQAFIDYIILDYDSAILKYSKIIRKYPSLKNIDYIYYMKALCFYEQLSHEGLDGEYNNLALKNLTQVVNRFPDSQYAKDSIQKIILVKSNIAAKHMTIGRFYQKNKKFTAALNRYKIVIDDYSESKFTPEALYRISEIYFTIGMVEEASNTAAILGYNFPDSEWYLFGYNNLLPENKNNNLKSIFNKYLKDE